MISMAVAFDTLKFVRNLTRAGLPEAQAEVFANAHRDAFKEALDSNLATKGDIAELRSEMAEFRAEMAEFRESTNSQIAEFKESTNAQIAELKESTNAQIAELKESTNAQIAELKESTNAQIAELKESTNAQIAELRSEMVKFKEFIMAEISQLKRRDDHLQAQISHLKWIMIFNLGFTVTIMWKVFS